MRAVVLAAGTGSRLWPLTADTPKCLISLGPTTILDRLLDQLQNTGCFTQAVVVTGFAAEQLDAFAQRWSMCNELEVLTIHNDRYAHTNNLFSLYRALDWFDEGFVLIDGDLVLSVDIVGVAAGCERSTIIVDSDRALDAEAMKCRLDCDGRLRQLSKSLAREVCHAESIGLSFIDGDDAKILGRRLEELVEQGIVDEYYERAYQDLLDHHGWNPDIVDIVGHWWEEVDDARDLERAQLRMS